MDTRRVESAPSALISALGALLFLFVSIYHAREVFLLGRVVGPLLAFLLDGIPALFLVYGGYRLQSSSLDPEYTAVVLRWTIAGAALLTAINVVSLLVHFLEGRTVPEPVFTLSLAASAGAMVGFVAGFFNARARADAERAEQATNAFAFVNGVLRHDLRNDLSIIRGFTELVEREAEGEVDERIETIREKADEAIEHIDNTRAIAETLSGEAEREPVDLSPVAAESAARIDETFDEVTVTTDLPVSVRVLADEGIRSVVDNLLENAVEHNDADNPKIHVGIGTTDGSARLHVRDNGPGVSGEEVFEPREEGSHGGGLHLIKTLVESYDGEIWVEDVEPRGSEFVVELPRLE